MALVTPQTTVPLVKELGGLNESSDYLLWRFDTPDELDAALTRSIQRAASRIYRLAPALYASTDENALSDLALGESWLALHLATMALKGRKVFGTHWALDQEGSDRFQELIDNEYLARAEEALGIDLSTSSTQTSSAFARPTFTVGRAVDRLTDTLIDTEAEAIETIAERARSLTGVL